jgi:hypothetical protein
MVDISRDIAIIKNIIKHCKNITLSQKRFGNDIKYFSKDVDYVNSVCMSFLQIGELANQ